MRIEDFDHVALRVSDVDRSIAWYTDVLGLEREQVPAWGDYPVVLKAGHASVALFQAPRPDLPPPAEHSLRVTHIAFRLGRREFDEAREELAAKGLDAEFQDHEVCHSLYVRDPDGHQVELTTYDVAGD